MCHSAVQMYRPLQSATGGFGGGHGQSPHVIGSYASVLALVIVGGEEAYDLIDRKAMSVPLNLSCRTWLN